VVFRVRDLGLRDSRVPAKVDCWQSLSTSSGGRMTYKLGWVVENDGEVAVLIPVLGEMGRFLGPYRYTRTQRRALDETTDEFLRTYPVVNEGEETKLAMLDALRITREEMCAAMQLARSEDKERNLLIDLVYAFRKERAAPK
jgi:hypothetical protein